MKIILVTILSMSVFSNIVAAQPVHICDDEAEFPPYTYWERINGKPNKSRLTGATTEFMEEIFSLIGMKYTHEMLPWIRCRREVEHFGKSLKYEVFSNGSYSEERAKKFYVTAPIYKTHEGLWYSKKKFPKGPEIRQANDINQYELCGVLGNNYEWLPVLGVTREVETGAKNMRSVLMKLSSGRCDFYVGGLENTYGGEAIGQYTIPEDVVGIRFPVGDREPTFHFFIAKTSPRSFELYTKINQAILLLQYRGKAEEIYKRYLPGGDGL